MRYLLTNLPLNLGEEALDLALPLARTLGGAASDYAGVVLERRSLDARHKGSIRFLTALSFCLLYTSPSPRDRQKSRMPSSA